MGFNQPADFVADLDTAANHAWITGFGQNTPAAMAAGYGLATYLPTLMGSQYNHIDYMTPVPYTAGGAPPAGGKILRNTTTTLSGAASLQFTINTINDGLQTRGPLMRCQEGRGYAVSMTWYKETALVLGEVDGVLSWFDSNKALLSTSLVCTFVTATDNQWTTTIDAATAPTGARYFTLGVAVNAGTVGGATGSVYVDEMLIDEVAGGVPVGSITAWDEWSPNNRGGTAMTLPSGWKKCDGSTVTDKLSIYYNTAMPDLNGTSVGTTLQDGQFLRGWTRASGVPGVQAEGTKPNGLSAQMATHQHSMVGATAVFVHQHQLSTSTTGGGTFAAVAANTNLQTLSSDFTSTQKATSWTGNTGNSVTNPFCTLLGDAETRPKNYGVTWIKRIR